MIFYYAFKAVVDEPLRSLKSEELKIEYYRAMYSINTFPDGDIEKGMFEQIEEVYRSWIRKAGSMFIYHIEN